MPKPSIDLYYSDPKKFAFESAKYAYEDLGMKNDASWVDPNAGTLFYKDVVSNPNSVAAKIAAPWTGNTAFLQQQEKLLQDANATFKQATGQDLRGDALDVVKKHLFGGNDVNQALSNLGNLGNYVKFSTDYAGTPSGTMSTAGVTQTQVTPTSTPATPAITPLNTADFAAQYRAATGQAPTQEVLNDYVTNRNTKPLSAFIPQAGAPTSGALYTIQKGDTLSALAKTYGTDVATLMKLNPSITNPNLIQAGATLNVPGKIAPVSPTEPSGVMTSKSLEPAKPTILPDAGGAKDVATDAAVVASSAAATEQSLQDYINRFTTAPTAAETQQQTILNKMVELAGGDSRELAQKKAEQAAGIGDLTANVNNILNEIKAKRLEFEAFKQAQEGKPVTMASITGSIAEKQGKIASDILLLQAQGDIAMGQLTNAQNKVDRAIDLEFGAKDNLIKVYQAQLEALKPTLNKEETIRANALSQMNSDRAAALAEQKQAKKDEKDYLLGLMSKYPDAKIGLNDSIASAQSKVNGSKIYQDQVRAPVGSGGDGTIGTGTGGALTDLDILRESVSNKIGSVAAKNSFNAQYAKAKTDEQRLKILAANVVLPTEIKNGIIQNTQVTAALDDVLGMLDKGVQTGLLKAGQSYIANKLGTGGDKEIEAIKSKLVASLQPYRNKVTGAAWGPQEEAEYQSLIGSVKFSPEDLRNKLEVFKQTLKQQSQTAILAGIDPLGAINQTSIIQKNPNLTTQPVYNVVNSGPTPTPETQKGFWSKTANWLWGD